jgi:hypothetical protein
VSFLTELRAVREQVLAQGVKDIEVPVLVKNGQDVQPKWVVRFRPPPSDEKLIPVAGALASGQGVSVEQASDLIIDCCGEVMRFTPDGPVSIEPQAGPLRFDGGDERWGLPDGKQTAREAVSKLYNLDVRPLALAYTVQQLVLWLQGLQTVVEDAVTGESEGGEAS